MPLLFNDANIRLILKLGKAPKCWVSCKLISFINMDIKIPTASLAKQLQEALLCIILLLNLGLSNIR